MPDEPSSGVSTQGIAFLTALLAACSGGATPSSAPQPALPLSELVAPTCAAEAIDPRAVAEAINAWPLLVSMSPARPDFKCGEVELAALDPAACRGCAAGKAGEVSMLFDRQPAGRNGDEGRAHFTFKVPDPDEAMPGPRGICVANRAANWPAQPWMSWMEDVDGDGRHEVILWDQLELHGAGSSCRAVLPVVYRVGGDRLVRSARSGAALYQRLSQTYRALGSEEPRFRQLSAALAAYAATHLAPAIALPAVSADGSEVAYLDGVDEAISMASWVSILRIDASGAIERETSAFSMGGTEDPHVETDKLQEYLTQGGFTTISLVPVPEGKARIDVDGIAVAIRGGRRVRVTASRAGRPIGSLTDAEARPAAIGLVQGPRPFLLLLDGPSTTLLALD